jgi:hypothetical protein
MAVEKPGKLLINRSAVSDWRHHHSHGPGNLQAKCLESYEGRPKTVNERAIFALWPRNIPVFSMA